jgi:hypothetical protein
MTRATALLAAPIILFVSAFGAENADQPTSSIANTSIDLDNASVAPSIEVPVSMASKPSQGLKFSLGPTGLVSLRYNGQELIFKPGGPELSDKPKFKDADGMIFRPSDEATAVGDGDTVTQTCSWGSIQARFSAAASRLTIHLTVENTSRAELQSLDLRLTALRFPQTPTCAVMEGGMWGKGGVSRLGSRAVQAGGNNSPAVIAIQSPVMVMYFCGDTSGEDATLGIPNSLGGAIRRAFPLVTRIGPIPSGGKRRLTYSLRFFPSDPINFKDAAGDVLESFAKRYPFTLRWDDRRAIGMMFLATSGVKGEQQKINPRRWMVVDGGRFDMTTLDGKMRFQQGVLKWADNAVKVHLQAGAQGMVTWDIEGQEHPSATFYGEPHLVGKLAPEMEEEVQVEVMEHGQAKTMKMPLIDAYFRKFRDAGLRTGVCLRPQEVRFHPNGHPYQAATSGDDAYQDIKEDLEYAKKRWGCTLFYLDSTVDHKAKSPLEPELFERLQQEHPDVLLMPENQALRYYTCSAPLDSMIHHGVSSTAPRIQALWPESFSVLMANDGTKVHGQANTPEARAERRVELLDGVARGDILMFNGWYMNPGAEEIISIYNDVRGGAWRRSSRSE